VIPTIPVLQNTDILDSIGYVYLTNNTASFNLSQYFSAGSSLSYSATASNLDSIFHIISGILNVTGSYLGASYKVTITATSTAGSTNATLWVTEARPPVISRPSTRGTQITSRVDSVHTQVLGNTNWTANWSFYKPDTNQNGYYITMDGINIDQSVYINGYLTMDSLGTVQYTPNPDTNSLWDIYQSGNGIYLYFRNINYNTGIYFVYCLSGVLYSDTENSTNVIANGNLAFNQTTFEYPPTRLTHTSTTLANHFYGNGVYLSSCSSFTYSSSEGYFHSFMAFDKNSFTFWKSNSGYDSTTGEFTGNSSVTINNAVVRGEWLKLQLASSTVISYYTITNHQVDDSPHSWTLAGSTNGITWALLDRQTNVAFNSNTQTLGFNIGFPAAYSYYVLVITDTQLLGTGSVSVNEFKLFQQ
jgi:hypothetical protein